MATKVFRNVGAALLACASLGAQAQAAGAAEAQPALPRMHRHSQRHQALQPGAQQLGRLVLLRRKHPAAAAHVSLNAQLGGPAAQLPGADFHELAGVGHFPQDEAPELVLPLVEKLLLRASA